MTIPKRVAVTEVSHWHSVNDASYLRILRDLGYDIVGVSDRSARIVADSASGLNDLYVAITRATQRLGVVHGGDLPGVLSRLRSR